MSRVIVFASLMFLLACVANAQTQPTDPLPWGLVSQWQAPTQTDTGESFADLSISVDGYLLFECGSDDVIAEVAGGITSYTEPGIVEGTGTWCREVEPILSSTDPGVAVLPSDRMQATAAAIRSGGFPFTVQTLPD